MTILLSLFLTSALYSEMSFEYKGVDVAMKQNGKVVHYLVKRERAQQCRKLRPSMETIWGGDFAGSTVPDICKSTFIKTTGKILPIKMREDIETYGELEVLMFLKEMQKDKSKVLIDARKEPWFMHRTIPGAVNMPFYYFRDREYYKDEFAYALKYLGGKPDGEGGFDFDDPKTIVVFCNGPWCSLSSQFVDAITEVGFPEEHIKWYRDGMQGWLIGGFTSTTPPAKKEK
jgi:rhodanese-related sulfurtransferase